MIRCLYKIDKEAKRGKKRQKGKVDLLQSTSDKEVVIRLYYLLRIILILAGFIIFLTWHKSYWKAKKKAKHQKQLFPQTSLQIEKPIERLIVLLSIIILLMLLPKTLLFLANKIAAAEVQAFASKYKLVQIVYLITVCLELALIKWVILKDTNISIREYIFLYLLRSDIKNIGSISKQKEGRIAIIIKGLCLSSFVAGILTYLNSLLYQIYKNINEEKLSPLQEHDSKDYLSKIFVKGGGIEQILDPEVFLYVIIIILIAPIIEEILFRGTVLGVLLNHMSFIKANIITSLLFALIHFNIYLIIPLIGLGYVLGLSYEKAKTLYVPILVHSLWNQLNIATYIFLYS